MTVPTDAFQPGEPALFVDSRQRRRLVVLETGGQFHSHAGTIPHDDVIGGPPCSEHRSTQGARWMVARPTLEDFVLTMPRGAQVIYPKDLAAMCTLADVGPGMRVFETGVGSGALSIALLRLGALLPAMDPAAVELRYVRPPDAVVPAALAARRALGVGTTTST